MKRSFRFQLAARFTGMMTAVLVSVALLSYLSIRETLDRQINATLVNVASIQAASVTEAPSGEMKIREWEVTPSEAASIRDLSRYTQVWSAEGSSLLRTRYLTEDLPLDTTALLAANGGETVRVGQEFQGGPIRSLYYPLGRFGSPHEPHVLQVAAPLDARDRTLRRLALLLSVITLVTAAGAFAGSWWLAATAVRPVKEIIGQAEEIRAGTLERRLTATTDTLEADRLIQVLNTMLERLDAAFEAQRRFIADASHELRSPLTAMRGELELARRRERNPEEYRDVIDSALEEVDRLSRTTGDLLTLARSDAGVMQLRIKHVNVDQCAARVVDRMRTLANSLGVVIALDAQGGAPVYADPDLIERLIQNLIENAIKFTPKGGSVTVHVDRRNDDVEIDVLDSGPGLPSTDLERIFERFHRVDESRTRAHDGSGSGLGLTIVRTIAHLHHGDVSAANRPEGGALFRVRLPVTPEANLTSRGQDEGHSQSTK